MKIVICGSIDFTPQIKNAADKLNELGHDVEIPLTSRRIIEGELTLEEFQREKLDKGDGAFRANALRKIKDDVIRYYFGLIKEADAILVLNLEKRGVPGYIGGNTFLEMGFAHVLRKKIYLYHDIPELPYADEIRAMQSLVIMGDLAKIS